MASDAKPALSPDMLLNGAAICACDSRIAKSDSGERELPAAEELASPNTVGEDFPAPSEEEGSGNVSPDAAAPNASEGAAVRAALAEDEEEDKAIGLRSENTQSSLRQETSMQVHLGPPS